MICAYFVKRRARALTAPGSTASRRGGVDRAWCGFYDRTLAFVLRAPALTMPVFVATIALTVGLYIKTPKGYFPQDDTGLIVGGTQASTDISFERDAGAATAGYGRRAGRSGGGGARLLRRQLAVPAAARSTAAGCSSSL